MEKKNKLLEYSVVYGLILGLIIVLYQIMLYFFGLLNNNILEPVIFFLVVIGTMLAVRHYRDSVNGGLLNFAKSYQIGFFTCVITGIIKAIYTYFQVKYLSPNLADEALTLAQESLLNRGYTDEQVELGSTILKNHIHLIVSISDFIRICFWGALLSLVIASIMKRDENPLQTRNTGNNNKL
jgi:hypothetical protein